MAALSIPAPVGADNAAVWADARTREQIAEWHRPAAALGYPGSVDDFTAFLRARAGELLAVRRAVVAPFNPYTEWTGAEQGWRMFATINREPGHLVIALRSRPGSDFETIYEARSPTATWNRGKLDQERMRAIMNVWSWSRSRGTFRAFAAWVAREAARDFPDADSVRVSLSVARLPTPAELRAGVSPPSKRKWPETIRLEGAR